MRFLIFITLLFAQSCGRFSEVFQRTDERAFTEVSFPAPRIDEPGLSPQAVLVGGVMIYAVNTLEPFRRGGRKLPDEGQKLTWPIPTAEYVFYAVGWQAPNLSNGSPMMCGKTAGPIKLQGEPISVQLVLSSNFCGQIPFSAPGWNNGNQPQPLYVGMCGSAEEPTIGASCSFTTRDLKVSFPSFDAWNGEIKVSDLPGQSIESACLTATPTPVVQSIVIPSGSNPPGTGFVMGVNTFTGGSCTGTKRLYGFADGMYGWHLMHRNIYELNGAPVSAPSPRSKVGSNGTNLYLYLKDF